MPLAISLRELAAGQLVSLREAGLYLAISLRELAAGQLVSLREAALYLAISLRELAAAQTRFAARSRRRSSPISLQCIGCRPTRFAARCLLVYWCAQRGSNRRA